MTVAREDRSPVRRAVGEGAGSQSSNAVVHPQPWSRALGRVAAWLAVASAAIHVLLLDDSLAAAVMVGMAAVCLPCAWHLWRSPNGSVWRFTALLDVTMLVLHVQMFGSSAHQMTRMTHASSVGGLIWLALVLVTAQLGLACAAMIRR